MATKPRELGVREARRIFPTIVDAAAKGALFIITFHGKPQCAVVPMEAMERLDEPEPRKPAKRRPK